MGGSSSTTSTEVNYDPQTAQALEQEIQAFLGQIQPIQRQQMLAYTTLMRNQPGAAGAGAGALAPPSTFAPLGAARTTAQNRLNLPEAQTANIGEGLQAGQTMFFPQAYSDAREMLGKGVQSFIDPRFIETMRPVTQQSTETNPDEAQMGMQAAGLAVAIAVAAIVI